MGIPHLIIEGRPPKPALNKNMAAKLKFVWMKPTVKFHPIYCQWMVKVPTARNVIRPHSITLFATWDEAIGFALGLKRCHTTR